MKISIIASVGLNREIGRENRLCWSIKEDLIHFKRTTLGHHLLMGRKTFESLKAPLPGRISLVLSRRDYQGVAPQGVQWVKTPEEALRMAEESGETELFIIGGESLFEFGLLFSTKIYLSRINAVEPRADRFFPLLPSDWKLEESRVFTETKASPQWTLEVYGRSQELTNRSVRGFKVL